ncbi:MAG: type II toxin-antitoxin system VapC family toxin [Gemmataceae bacterium]
MILLDTDHLTILQLPETDRAERLRTRLRTATATHGPIGTTIVNVEESMRGWMSSIAKERNPLRQIGPYRELGKLFGFFVNFALAPFDTPAAALFSTFGRIHIGASDRKIAAIAMTRPALFLTANRQDFEQIPGLRFENWLD